MWCCCAVVLLGGRGEGDVGILVIYIRVHGSSRKEQRRQEGATMT